MANIRTGSIVSDIRGKVGSEIYSRNRGGAYVKAYAAPANPNSSFQISARGRLTTAVNWWSGLSDAEKQTWERFAASKVINSKLGGVRVPSGRELFISRAIGRTYSSTSTPPLPFDSGISLNPVSFSPVIPGGTNFQFQFIAEKSEPGVRMVMYTSRFESSQKRSINSVFTPVFLLIDGYQSLTANVYTLYNSIFGQGAIPVGTRIFCRVKCFDVVTGQELLNLWNYATR